VKREERLIYENPTFSELNLIETVKDWSVLRAVIVDNKTIYAFDDILHTKVITHFNLVKPLCVEFNFLGDIKKFQKYDCTCALTSSNLNLGWDSEEGMKEFLFSNSYLNEYFDITEVFLLKDSF
jgi:hypothetical protein